MKTLKKTRESKGIKTRQTAAMKAKVGNKENGMWREG